MEAKDLQELWHIRFAKMIREQEMAYLFYRSLLKKKRHLFAGTETEKQLQKIQDEEALHIRVAEGLLDIVDSV